MELNIIKQKMVFTCNVPDWINSLNNPDFRVFLFPGKQHPDPQAYQYKTRNPVLPFPEKFILFQHSAEIAGNKCHDY